MGSQKEIYVHFLGAAGTVTGSKYLVDTGDYQLMIDCGLFQGLKKLRALNWIYPTVQIENIDAIILTHGHMDHSGYIPRMIKGGYKGPVYGTSPTLDIAEIILKDSAKIQEEEADRANRKGYTKHDPAKPLYTVKDAEKSIEHFSILAEGEWIELFPGIRIRLNYVGHIIGATFIELEIRGKVLVFSGDIGREEDLLMFPPKKPVTADYLFLESTYGDRLHAEKDPMEELREVITKTLRKAGTLIIPSFAVERTQTLMYLLWKLRQESKIPGVPMIMDSPMGANVLKVFKTNMDWHKLPMNECIDMCNMFTIVDDFEQTIKIIEDKNPKIVIAGSGMVSGGRVLSYLQKYLSMPETSVLLTGFQAEGTRGRALLRGTHELKIYGKYYPVKAEIFSMESLSAHADQGELVRWVNQLERAPKKVFVTHGEPAASESLRIKMESEYGWSVYQPELYEIIKLD